MTTNEPIQNVDKTDIIGQRKDGGVDLIVVVSGPIDGSELILSTLRCKVRNYIRELLSSKFLGEYPGARDGRNRIIVMSEHFIDPRALALIDELKLEAEQAGANLVIRDTI